MNTLNKGQPRKKLMLIDGMDPDMIRVAISSGTQLQELEYHSKLEYGRGSIHLGIVTNVFPSIQAAFVSYKKSGRDGFLSFSEVRANYLETLLRDGEVPLIEDNDVDISTDDCINPEIAPAQEELSGEIQPDEEIENESGEIESGIESIVHDSEKKLESPPRENERVGEHYSSSSWREIRTSSKMAPLKKGQVVLVQITKEEHGNKGAALSNFISLSGKYCTLIANRSGRGGISRNVTNIFDKKRLELILDSIPKKNNSSLLLNQTALRKSVQEIYEDYEALQEQWKEIKARIAMICSGPITPPAVLYYEMNLIRNIFYNLANLNVKNIIIEGEKIYKSAVELAQSDMEDFINIIKLHSSNVPIFSFYNIEDSVNNLFSSVVPLRSGGYIVINKTEAFTSVDVNSGRNNDEKNIEETAVKTNLDAILELSSQIKLRKISGMIIVDLITMIEPRNNRMIEHTMKRISSTDKAKTQIHFVEAFGLLVMSRQRIEQSLEDLHCEKCSACNGLGIMKSYKFTVGNLLTRLRTEAAKNGPSSFEIKCSHALFVLLSNNYREKILELELRMECRINLSLNLEATGYDYQIIKTDIPEILALEHQDTENGSRSDKRGEIKKIIDGRNGNAEPLKNGKKPMRILENNERIGNGDIESILEIQDKENLDQNNKHLARSDSQNQHLYHFWKKWAGMLSRTKV